MAASEATFRMFVILLVQLENGWAMQILSKGRVYIVDVGRPVELVCEFEAVEFNLFDNPIIWRKRQLHEESQLNMMGNLVEPFNIIKRFKVTLHQQPPTYTFRLLINDSAMEDSANYSCEISGPQNSVIDSVAFVVLVGAKVDRVIISQTNETDTQRSTLVFVENHPTRLACTVFGHHPSPRVNIDVGVRDRRELDGKFQTTTSATMSGRRGMRRLYYTTTRWNPSFRATASEDGEDVRCRASADDGTTHDTKSRIDVHFSAVIQCENSSAYLGERNVNLRCEVKAKPVVTALYWVLDSNGTTLSEGEIINEHWALVMERLDGITETQLFMRQAKQENFRPYILVAENGVATRRETVFLEQRAPVTRKAEMSKQKTDYSSPRKTGNKSKNNDIYRNSTTSGHVIFRTACLVILVMTSHLVTR